MNSSTELIAFDMTVAIATPFTVICKTATKNRLRSTFNTPEKARAARGVFVSPTLRKIAASKLYSSMTGIPIRYILRYNSASGNTSSGTFSMPRRGAAAASPRNATKIPPNIATRTDVCSVFLTVSRSFLPMAFAITTFVSSAIPINRFTIRLIMGLFAPTAATDTVFASPVKFPTTATSEALKSCSKIAVAATGSANRGILFHIGPCIISRVRFSRALFICHLFLPFYKVGNIILRADSNNIYILRMIYHSCKA